MAVTTMSQMWSLLQVYTHSADGSERPVNHLNEWGGFSRKLNMPVFTAWFDHVEYDKDTKLTTAYVSDTTWRTTIGLGNQEYWVGRALENGGNAAFFIIHALDTDAERRKVDYIDDDRVIVGTITRRGTQSIIVGQPKPL